jgi:pimeloyl-ACP methyl ester carboxylesterase
MEHIVLLHGIGANSRTLSYIEKHLKRAGYRVHNWNYKVYSRSLEDIVSQIRDRVDAVFSEHHTVHFVGHSLGGVLSRGVMALGIRAKMGRLVTLGSPHKGAMMAHRFPLGRKIFKGIFGRKIVNDLSHDSTVGSLPYPNTEIGTISGCKRFHPADPVSWFTSKMLDEPHDGFISVRSTQIDIAENIVLDVDHCFMIFDKEVISQTIYFLKYGKFKNEKL